ncbi:MAG: hypothetical protein IT377_05435 [Polyangiaceae bacterium]|nr:hypothetical protein [Polyangiaceae bacterium]
MRPWLFVVVLAAACAPKAPVSPAVPGASAEPPLPSASAAARAPGAEAPADGKTRFAFVLPKPGSQRTERESTVLGLDITMTEGQKVIATEKSGEGTRRVRHTTVLANDGRAITKKKVRYEELVQVSKKGEREQRVPSPLTGKTYVIALEHGKTVYTSERGEPVSDVEVEALARDNKEFGKPPQFASFVPSRPLAPGEKFSPPAEALADMFGGDKSYGEVEFTFVGPDDRAGRKVGRFDFTMTITDDRQGAVTTIRSKGTVLLLAETGWPLELSLGGQVRISAPGDKPKRRVTGSGVLEMKLAAEYR